MNNDQCKGYTIVAIKNLLEAGKIQSNDKCIFSLLDSEMNYLQALFV